MSQGQMSLMEAPVVTETITGRWMVGIVLVDKAPGYNVLDRDRMRVAAVTAATCWASAEPAVSSFTIGAVAEVAPTTYDIDIDIEWVQS